jgi:hypothetical protein
VYHTVCSECLVQLVPSFAIEQRKMAAPFHTNKQGGMAHGKISRVLDSLFGIRLTRGGSTHVVLRAARRAEPVYASLCETVAQAPWTALDETGWHVGGRKAWLHALIGPQATA